MLIRSKPVMTIQMLPSEIVYKLNELVEKVNELQDVVEEIQKNLDW